MLIVLHGPWDHALKANRAMFDPILEVKEDCSDSQ
jgi:hypothetical protein